MCVADHLDDAWAEVKEGLGESKLFKLWIISLAPQKYSNIIVYKFKKNIMYKLKNLDS